MLSAINGHAHIERLFLFPIAFTLFSFDSGDYSSTPCLSVCLLLLLTLPLPPSSLYLNPTTTDSWGDVEIKNTHFNSLNPLLLLYLLLPVLLKCTNANHRLTCILDQIRHNPPTNNDDHYQRKARDEPFFSLLFLFYFFHSFAPVTPSNPCLTVQRGLMDLTDRWDVSYNYHRGSLVGAHRHWSSPSSSSPSSLSSAKKGIQMNRPRDDETRQNMALVGIHVCIHPFRLAWWLVLGLDRQGRCQEEEKDNDSEVLILYSYTVQLRFPLLWFRCSQHEGFVFSSSWNRGNFFDVDKTYMMRPFQVFSPPPGTDSIQTCLAAGYLEINQVLICEREKVPIQIILTHHSAYIFQDSIIPD